MNKLLVAAVLIAAAAAGAGFVAAARASGATCTAFVGGLQADKTSIPELVVFNTSGTPQPLDLVLRAPDGSALVTLPAALTVNGQQTATLDLRAQLAHAGAGGKAYSGVFTAEVTGAAPFSEATAVVHVTQYFGTRKKPKAGFVVRPVFSLAN